MTAHLAAIRDAGRAGQESGHRARWSMTVGTHRGIRELRLWCISVDIGEGEEQHHRQHGVRSQSHGGEEQMRGCDCRDTASPTSALQMFLHVGTCRRAVGRSAGAILLTRQLGTAQAIVAARARLATTTSG